MEEARWTGAARPGLAGRTRRWLAGPGASSAAWEHSPGAPAGASRRVASPQEGRKP